MEFFILKSNLHLHFAFSILHLNFAICILHLHFAFEFPAKNSEFFQFLDSIAGAGAGGGHGDNRGTSSFGIQR